MHKADVTTDLLKQADVPITASGINKADVNDFAGTTINPLLGQATDNYDNPVTNVMRAYFVRGWLGLVLHQVYEPSVLPDQIHIPTPESMYEEMGVDPQHCECMMAAARLSNLNLLAAEVLLQFGRYDEAMAHAKQFEADCLGSQVPCWAPWLQGRIMGRKAQSKKAPKGKLSESKEAFSLLQRAHAAAKAWGSPLIATLAVQEMIALCPKQAAANNAESLFEEERFELIMEKESPMRTHIESGGTFAPMGL